MILCFIGLLVTLCNNFSLLKALAGHFLCLFAFVGFAVPFLKDQASQAPSGIVIRERQFFSLKRLTICVCVGAARSGNTHTPYCGSIEMQYETDIFTQSKSKQPINKAYPVKKCILDYVFEKIFLVGKNNEFCKGCLLSISSTPSRDPKLRAKSHLNALFPRFLHNM